MKRLWTIALLGLASAGFAVAQKADVLGPHVNYGRGCIACHTRHSLTHRVPGAWRATASDTTLWGDDPLIAAMTAGPEHDGLLVCLSCHDGNYAPSAMMKSRIYESLPDSYGELHSVPTLTDKPAITTGVDIDKHPVGEGARMDCGGSVNWDCQLTSDGLGMQGERSARFASSYGFFVKPRRWGDGAIVVCTSCHNPHLLSVVNVTRESASALYPAGTYATRFFLRAPYNPDASNGAMQSAQFCRQCHADKSNEMNGSRVGAAHLKAAKSPGQRENR